MINYIAGRKKKPLSTEYSLLSMCNKIQMKCTGNILLDFFFFCTFKFQLWSYVLAGNWKFGYIEYTLRVLKITRKYEINYTQLQYNTYNYSYSIPVWNY